MKPKVITVFTEGDSSELRTWSNVPYFLTSTLENKGFVVNRVNVGSNKFVRFFFNKLVSFFKRDSKYFFNRTLIFEKMVERKMKKAVKKYKDTDIFISTSFSFSPWKYTKKKMVLFCDWTIDYYYKYFLNREPDMFEQSAINRQDIFIENSDYIISLFPNVADYMKDRYRNKKISYIGNVINSEVNIDRNEILESKVNSYSLIFIGNTKYLEGAKCLIKAFELVKRNYPNLKLNIIGLNKEHFDYLPQGVSCYGYLDKSKKEDKELYYRLMAKGKLLVNTTPKWGAFSSTVEAMHWYTPIITTPYLSFVETFSNYIEFGFYCDKNDPNLLSEYIVKVLELDNKNYLRMCVSANKVVQRFTWDNYVDNLLKTIEE